MTQELAVLDLDGEAELRAAQHEGKRQPLPIRWRGETIATLPVELPFDVIAPIHQIDNDLTLLLRQAMQVVRSNGRSGDERWDAAEIIIDVLAGNPQLPSRFVKVIKDMATALLGEDGLELFLAGKPSITGDMAALAKGILRHYGVSLGESSPSSASSESQDGGGTSNTTSSTSSESTPEDSSQSPDQIAS